MKKNPNKITKELLETAKGMHKVGVLDDKIHEKIKKRKPIQITADPEIPINEQLEDIRHELWHLVEEVNGLRGMHELIVTEEKNIRIAVEIPYDMILWLLSDKNQEKVRELMSHIPFEEMKKRLGIKKKEKKSEK
jgi:hypothetical protein